MADTTPNEQQTEEKFTALLNKVLDERETKAAAALEAKQKADNDAAAAAAANSPFAWLREFLGA